VNQARRIVDTRRVQELFGRPKVWTRNPSEVTELFIAQRIGVIIVDDRKWKRRAIAGPR